MKPRVGLFVTCLVDLMRPNVGFAALRLLDTCGVEVVVPENQTCCGQPAYNGGDMENARAVARDVIAAFEGFDHVVVPSGSCAGMIRVHYPKLFDADDAWRARAEALSAKTWELTQFLSVHLDLNQPLAKFRASVTYHDSCSGLRELGVKAQPRRLLAAVDGVTLRELEDTEECCGFGGLFSVKHPDISMSMADKKADRVEAAGTDVLAGGDLGCLANIAGRLKKRGSAVRVLHVAEILAGMGFEPAIGEGEDGA
ncbi:MAG: (Fe-S)-binding protein [Alphaproteobacteria bacterium]|nr:(Fe-S)-binding protein [Alphaproteobacteria bacterium]